MEIGVSEVTEVAGVDDKTDFVNGGNQQEIDCDISLKGDRHEEPKYQPPAAEETYLEANAVVVYGFASASVKIC